MSLVRVTSQLLNRHESRRWHRGNLPPIDGDILRSLAYWRRSSRNSAHAAEQYIGHRAAAMRPVLGQLRMIEAAIRCDVACREAVAAWRGVMA